MFKDNRILGSLAVRLFYWMPIGNDSINGTGQSEAIIINGDASGEQVSGQLAQQCWHRKDACRKGCNHRKSQVTAYCCHGVASVHCCRAFIHSLQNMGIPLGLDRAGDERNRTGAGLAVISCTISAISVMLVASLPPHTLRLARHRHRTDSSTQSQFARPSR